MIHKTLFIILLCLLVLGAIYCYYYNRWKHLWAVASPQQYYYVPQHQDDTLRVLMIGDSWAGLHSELKMDLFLRSELERRVQRPVSVISKGKGGEKSKGIYQLMFQTKGYGTKPLFLGGADYCIISAGINDAVANWGTKQYCTHYRMILDFLLANGIRPVIIEIPDVNVWAIYGDKPKMDLLTDYVRSTMTRCGMYNFHEYREAFFEMLQEEQLMERVVCIPMDSWNGEGTKLNPLLFVNDGIHLNRKGYEMLDTSIAETIAHDLQQSLDTTFVNQPMNPNAE